MGDIFWWAAKVKARIGVDIALATLGIHTLHTTRVNMKLVLCLNANDFVSSPRHHEEQQLGVTRAPIGMLACWLYEYY
jgi:hypothetical protein